VSSVCCPSHLHATRIRRPVPANPEASIQGCPRAHPNISPIPVCQARALRRTPVTRSRKIYLASSQCVQCKPPPRRLPGRALLAAGRASAGQHLSPTRRRRKASSNSLPAFWIESHRSVPQDGIRLARRSPRAPSFQAQRACAGLDGRVNKFVTFHPTGKRGSGGPPGHCELGPAVVQCGASGDQRKASPLRLCSALRICSFTIPPKPPPRTASVCPILCASSGLGAAAGAAAVLALVARAVARHQAAALGAHRGVIDDRRERQAPLRLGLGAL